MGYQATNIVLYGVELTAAEAAKIFDEFNDEEEGLSFSSFEKKDYWRVRPVGEYFKNRPNYVEPDLPFTPYKQHDNGSGKSVVFDMQLLSEGTDSRIESLGYEEGYPHFLGIYIASEGYAYSDDEVFFIQNCPEEAKNAFELNVRPFIEKMNIGDKFPKVRVVHQTW